MPRRSVGISRHEFQKQCVYRGNGPEKPGVPVDTAAGAHNTVAFWMNWDGTASMPFGWGGDYDLYHDGGYFGFNTRQDNLPGISSAGMEHNWVHVAAVFYNGDLSADNRTLN